MWVPRAECQLVLGSWIHWDSARSEDSQMLEEGETGAVPCVGKPLLGGRTVHSSLQQNQSRKESRAGGQLCSLLQRLSNDLAPGAGEALQGCWIEQGHCV